MSCSLNFSGVLVNFQIDKEHTGSITDCLMRFYQVPEFFRQGIRKMSRSDRKDMPIPKFVIRDTPVKRYVLLKMKIISYLLLEVAD